MTNDPIRDGVVKTLREIAPESDPETLDLDADLRETLDLDSMDFLRFVTALHARFGVDVPERDYRSIATLGGCVRYLSAHGARALTAP